MIKRIFSLLLIVTVSVLALASCDVINGIIGEKECEHTFSESWSTDATNHWHAATCEHGENKDSLGAHADADEDGKCDVCAYEVGHEHTFASEWTTSDDKHWKAATCSHTDAKGEEALHKDDNTDGVCDVCYGHVHILDTAGFCEGCDKEVKPVDETDLAAVVAATTARAGNVVSGSVEMHYAGYSRHEDSHQSMWHKQVFTIGTNGTYTGRTVNQVGHDGVATGKQELIERWIPYGTEETIEGVSATKVDGVYIDAMPTAYGPGDLTGYLYAISALSSEYGAEATLYALYEASQLDTASEFESTLDAAANKYTFSYNVFIVNESKLSDDSIVYNVNYYEVDVEFEYADDYTITAMKVECVCYTNDPGAGFDGTWEEDIDLDYDPVTNTITLRADAYGDKYVFTTTQVKGTRTEIEINDGSQFVPTGYDVYEDEACTVPGSTLEVYVGDHSKVFYIAATGEQTFANFFNPTVTVTTADGQATEGLKATDFGQEIQIFPYAAGEYIITVEAIGVTKTISVTVQERPTSVEYDGTFEITITDPNLIYYIDYYVFTAETKGLYHFYIPVGVGATIDPDEEPEIDYQSLGYDPNADHVIGGRDGIFLQAGGTYTIYFGAASRGTYTVGWTFEAV